MREIIFDTETTGMSPQDGHRMVEIGAIELIGRVPSGRTYHQYINPEREIDAGAIRVHGITNERVKDEPTFKEIADDFLEFIGDAALVAHNAPFDMNFMNFQYQDIGYPALSNEVIDTIPMARKKFPGARVNLDALCKRLDVDNSGRTFHGALLDSELLAEVYVHLTGGLQTGLTFEDEGSDEEEVIDFANKEILKASFQELRTFAVPEAEQKAHDEFVEKFKDSLWQQIKAGSSAS
ncbi:MAG: DNA polymerase III subunit epsilon [Pseudomonadota bacterium]|nr:DNA polymerase III subunit epsilon [Pseudomonadota bacterium]